MDIIKKWDSILSQRHEMLKLRNYVLNRAITSEEINAIEDLSGEILPDFFRMFYLYSNGQPDDSDLFFFGEKFMSAEDIIRSLEFSRTLLKPEVRTVVDREKADYFSKKIIEFYIINALVNNHESQESWYKMEFSVGINYYRQPSLYRTKDTTPREKEIIKIKDYSSIAILIEGFHELEFEYYNWDKLKFVVYSDGRYEMERIDDNFETEMFTSTPENAIKKKYFHHKWIPIFSDYGGNFIGIDLDPDVNGKRGQIINFGRDEEDMYVIANDLEQFFDFILAEINENGGETLAKYHLHDSIKAIIKNKEKD